MTSIIDQVVALRDGNDAAYYAIVNGKFYGPWRMIEYARAGLQVEQRRAAKKAGLPCS